MITYIPCDVSHGSAIKPLKFTSYGTGQAVLKAKGCTLFNVFIPETGIVKLGLEIKNLILEGDSVPRSGPKNAIGISVWNTSSSVMDYLLIEDVEIRGFAGDGIAIGRVNGKGRYTNLKIRNVVSHHNPGAIGVSPHTGSGIIVGGSDGALIEHCMAHNNGINNKNDGGPIGIWFWDSLNSTIQYCESYENKTTMGDGGGFDLDGGCKDCIIQYSYAHDNDGAGFLLAQFAGANSYGPLTGNIIRYNISENDGRKGSFSGIYLWGANSTDKVGINYIYNNTVYTGGTAINGTPACIAFLGNQMSGVKIWNNIFMANNNCDIINASSAFTTNNVLFQNNAYYTDASNTFKIKWGTSYNSLLSWRNASNGQEMNGTVETGMQTNPLFEDAGNGHAINNTYALGSLQAYQLSNNSPLIDAGLNLMSSPFNLPNVGIYDFYQHAVPVGGKYDIGVYDSNKDNTKIEPLTYNTNKIVVPNFVTSNWINIQSNVDMKSISVLSIGGQTITKYPCQNPKQIEFLHQLLSGIYLIKIETSEGICTRKIIVRS